MFDDNYLQITSKKYFYPDLKQSWILALFFLPALLVSYFLGEILNAVNTNPDIITLIEYVVSLGIILAIAFSHKRAICDKPFVYYKNKISVLTYILVIPAVISLGGLADAAGEMILPEMPEFIKNSLGKAMNSSLPTILTAVVAAPVFEEIICRGIICEGLIKNISPRAGILWSAFIFAVIHLNPWQGFSAFAIGCFLGWVYWKTRSIIPCIFIHFVNNGLALYLYHYFCEKSNYDFNVSVSEIYGINEIFMLIIYAAVFLASFGLLAKILKSKA
jgi:membrane protease YdiL (CAAX protease family)